MTPYEIKTSYNRVSRAIDALYRSIDILTDEFLIAQEQQSGKASITYLKHILKSIDAVRDTVFDVEYPMEWLLSLREGNKVIPRAKFKSIRRRRGSRGFSHPSSL